MSGIKGARIDGALKMAMQETASAERSLSVFVHTQVAAVGKTIEELRKFGISIPRKPTKIFTATLSPKQVEELAGKEWVSSLRLSSRLKPLDEE